ncbi:MAG: ChaN family lipoprotein [Myxococcota bacterium]|nr:ChaN family lipoprotein [Myxococcota bacterium]
MSKELNTFRQEIVTMHKAIFRRNQHQIDESTDGYSPAFRRYKRRYQKYVQTYQYRSRIETLEKAIHKAQIIYVGDYHTLPQSQRSFLRLLKRTEKQRPLAIALEFVQGCHQAALDDFTSGLLSERAFLETIDHENHWVFEGWMAFKPIFDFARENNCALLAIDARGKGAAGSTLLKRDQYSARKLANFHKHHPHHQIMTLVGEYHVAPPHLPKAVNDQLRAMDIDPLKHLSIYQNCENIYWELEEKGHEQSTPLVKISPREYSIIIAPPIVCQQSFLNWLDIDEELPLFGAPETNFRRYANLIASFFDLPIGDALDEVEVASVVDLSFLARLQKRGDFTQQDVRQIKKQILSSESYYIPKAKMVYLGNLSVNHASEEATHFLRHICSKSLEPKHLVDAFYARAMEEAVGFLGSKIINHLRKCPHTPDLERIRRNKNASAFHKEMARLILKHGRLLEGTKVRNSAEIYDCDAEMFNAVTHVIGYQLGERIYYSLVDGTLDKHEIRELFFDCFEDDGAAFTTYLYFFTRTKDIDIPERL